VKKIVQVKFLDHSVIPSGFIDELEDPVYGYVWGLLYDEDEYYYYIITHYVLNTENADYFKVVKSAIVDLKEIGEFSE